MHPGSKQIAGAAIASPPADKQNGMMYDKECCIMYTLARHSKRGGHVVKYPSFVFGKICTKFSTRGDRQRE